MALKHHISSAGAPPRVTGPIGIRERGHSTRILFESHHTSVTRSAHQVSTYPLEFRAILYRGLCYCLATLFRRELRSCQFCRWLEKSRARANRLLLLGPLVAQVLVGLVLYINYWGRNALRLLESQALGDQLRMPRVRLISDTLGGYCDHPVEDLDMLEVRLPMALERVGDLELALKGGL